jgi:glycosyltransferase involved in cell wall biosynthesis
MKLLLYSHSFAPNVGGVETVVLSLARGLADLRTVNNRPLFDLTVATETSAGDFDDTSLPFTVVRHPGVLALRRLIGDADVIHLAGPVLLPLLLATLARKPVALEHHGYQAICPNGLLLHQPDGSICPGHFQAARYGKCVSCQSAQMSWFRSLISVLLMFPRNALARRASRNLAISTHVLKRHNLPRSQVIYYGIDASSEVPPRNTDTLVCVPWSHATRESAHQTPPSPLKKVTFAYVGRLVPEKGLPVLLAATSILRREGFDFTVLLVGDGPERQRLEAAIAHTGLTDVVHITGFLRGAALTQMLSGVGVVVMPSVWEETAGLAAIEHMMRGRPVIASKIGGLGEVVGDSGITCRAGDPEDLARCMKDVLQNPANIVALGRHARERAKSLFLRERMIVDHRRVYQEISRSDT